MASRTENQAYSRQMDAVKGDVKGNHDRSEIDSSNRTTTPSTDTYIDDTTVASSESAASEEARVRLGFVDDKFIRQLLPS